MDAFFKSASTGFSGSYIGKLSRYIPYACPSQILDRGINITMNIGITSASKLPANHSPSVTARPPTMASEHHMCSKA
jgi:hypothetical protein